ncbi:BZ3500_MvSof-1268-A1-R1_Chr6-3g08788 [Microbotryum saponariae]|uniref:hydroxymethylglutaryl-CoA lyase n=1 Tax=Microbotryum saponariae TaxID=289078 RepID=A0A2X0LN08_9BASI|nr:BZ3500_MvSof-1268-A1-R1_Chr6-3g08788 [Microbotryum saponariae]SDA07389.1 BZ3501_MvSof-1269-A2-R1_Chr6-2g08491 [Microbotryum saponariae]
MYRTSLVSYLPWNSCTTSVRLSVGAGGRQAVTASFSTSSSSHAQRTVKLIEVGPRDGLQNEKAVLTADLKTSLITKLANVGLRTIEAGSFVAPKWVPQMASTSEVMTSPALDALREHYGDSLSLPVLIPNAKGLSTFLSLLEAQPRSSVRLSNEIALFIAASEGFSKANLNTTVQASLDSLPPLIEQAKTQGLKVRAYISTVLGCPFDGRVDKTKVADLSKSLLDMGAYEVSLGDTIGVGTPKGWEELIELCRTKGVDVDKLAAHCHDTYGTAVANVLKCVELGISSLDTSIGGLGGCPYSPGATGNVATEDVIYALETSGISTSLLPSPLLSSAPEDLLDLGSERARKFVEIAEVGEWVSAELGRTNASRAGAAAVKRMRWLREKEEKRKAKM